MNFNTHPKKLFTTVICLILFTQIVSAKSKNGFDVDKFRKHAKNNEAAYTGSNGSEVREIETPLAFIQKEYNGAHIHFREFNKSGKLQREGTYAKVAKQEIPVGEWKTFDSKGKVTEIKNHEEGFQVTFDQIVEICQKRNINLTDRLSTLTKSKPGERPMWVIGWNSLPPRSEKTSTNDRSPTTKMEVIVVDGVTGDIKESTPYVPFKN